MSEIVSNNQIPFFGVRRFARRAIAERDAARDQLDRIAKMGRGLVQEVKALRAQVERLGLLPILELEGRRFQLQEEINSLTAEISGRKHEAADALDDMQQRLLKAQAAIAVTDEMALLQEVGIYKYRHPLTDAVAYEKQLAAIDRDIKAMTLKDGGAVLATTHWTVNGSESEGRAMVRDFSKLMLRAFNAEADNLVRFLKPFKLDAAIDRLNKVAEIIARLGKTMNIRISNSYHQLRVRELELTADFLEKQAEEKEKERRARENLREEKKVQQEIERERARLEKERQHHSNVLDALVAKSDQVGVTRVQAQLAEIDRNMKSVDYRAANTRAGYVYVISNIGAFGDKIVKIGMTRRLDPTERIRELSDASVPFNFDVHAMHFSDDAVSIEGKMHDRLAYARVNLVNARKEFFRVSPLDARKHLSAFAGELLQFKELPEAIEYRQCLRIVEKNEPTLAPA